VSDSPQASTRIVDMVRRKKSGLDIVKSSPWPVGIAVGSIAFPVIRYGIGWYPAPAPTGIFKQVGPHSL
jgi:restriction system protein